MGKGLVLKAIEGIRLAIGQADIYAAIEKDNRSSRSLLDKVGFTLINRADVKDRYRGNSGALFSRMMLMPWEDLYILR